MFACERSLFMVTHGHECWFCARVLFEVFGLRFQQKGQVTGLQRHRREHPSETSPCPPNRMADAAALLDQTALRMWLIVPSPVPDTDSNEDVSPSAHDPNAQPCGKPATRIMQKGPQLFPFQPFRLKWRRPLVLTTALQFPQGIKNT